MSSQISSRYFYGFPAHSKNLEHIFQTIPAITFCKDKQGKYTEANDICVHITGNKSNSDVVGKTDRQLIWAEHSGLSVEHDKEIISSGKSMGFIEYGKIYTGKVTTCLIYKTPLLDRSSKIIGVFAAGFPLGESNEMLPLLEKMGFGINSDTINKILIKERNQINEFTERQLDCLCYLVKGMTIKQIARALNLSPRTIEHYLDNIKNKLSCNSRSELITKALQLPAIKQRLLSS